MNEFDELAATWDDDPRRMKRAVSIAESMRNRAGIWQWNRFTQFCLEKRPGKYRING